MRGVSLEVLVERESRTMCVADFVGVGGDVDRSELRSRSGRMKSRCGDVCLGEGQGRERDWAGGMTGTT